MAIWVKRHPGDEAGPYEIEFLIACEDEGAANNLDSLITDTFGTEASVKLETNEVRVQMTVAIAEATTLADAEGHWLSSF